MICNPNSKLLQKQLRFLAFYIYLFIYLFLAFLHSIKNWKCFFPFKIVIGMHSVGDSMEIYPDTRIVIPHQLFEIQNNVIVFCPSLYAHGRTIMLTTLTQYTYLQMYF